MKALKADSSPMLRATAATRTSAVLLAPRVVGAVSVSVSPGFTPSRLAWSWKMRMVPGLPSSASEPSTTWMIFSNPGSRSSSTPARMRSIDPPSATALAQPRPRGAA